MQVLIQGMVIAATVSMATAAVAMCVFSRETATRYTGSIAYAAGFIAAFRFLQPKDMLPVSHWHWLPWLAAISALIGAIGLVPGLKTIERWLLVAVFALAAGWLLVPTWKVLMPYRANYILAFAGSLLALWGLLDPIASRNSGGPPVLALGLSLLSGSAMTAYAVSAEIGFLGAAGGAALMGGGLAATWKQDSGMIRGMLGAASLVLLGTLMSARLYDGPPLTVLALIACAPLLLWLFELGPLAKLGQAQGLILKPILVAIPHVVAWVMVLKS